MLAQDEREDVAALRAECHPHPDFLRALTDGMRRDAVDADACEQHRDHRKPGEQHGAEARLRQCVGQLRIQRAGREEWQLRMQVLHLAADRRQNRGGLTGRPHHQHLRARIPLQRAQVHLRTNRARHGAAPHVPDDADDGDPGSLARLLAELDSSSERILSGPGELREGLVDDDRLRRVEVVLRR